MASVLIVLNPGAEEIEYTAPADVLVRAGQTVTLASSAKELTVAGSRGLPLSAQVRLDEVRSKTYDLLVLPGGSGSAAICRDDARLQDLLAAQLAAGRWLGLICAAPTALLPRGLAKGRRLTSFPSVRPQLEAQGAQWVDEPVVVDGSLITSQGAGTSLAFGLVLARMVAGPEVAARLARDMIASDQYRA